MVVVVDGGCLAGSGGSCGGVCCGWINSFRFSNWMRRIL